MKIKVVKRKLGREKAAGQAWTDDRKIEIDPRLRGKRALEIYIHETIHCIWPDMPESEVDRGAMVLMGVLWKEEYRRCDLGGK